MIDLSHLKKYRGQKKPAKRVGRGDSSRRGTYSGKGQKGQRARSGGRKGLKVKGLRAMIKQLPKNSGFRTIKPRLQIINLSQIDKKFNEADLVNAKTLFKASLIKSPKGLVKVLGQGNLTKKLSFEVNAYSKTAIEAIKKAGGSAVILMAKAKK